MKVSDYIVEFLIEKNVTDVFGYPGGMVTHLMDSFEKYKDKITAHVNYHEQASSFSACGYAMTKKDGIGVCYATSGPGATNLVTGIANAYFDSIPVIFITGQVNTYEGKGDLSLRQKGFQETDIEKIAKPISKYAKHIENPKDIMYELEKAYYISLNGRRGPVLLDIPMNVQRAEIEKDELKRYEVNEEKEENKEYIEIILEKLLNSKRPVIIAGAGINSRGMKKEFKELVKNLEIPVLTSMIAVDLIEDNSKYNFGFIGAYGHRCANFIIEKCDLILSLGSRLDVRQTGANKEIFAKNAEIVRVDIDRAEFENKIKENEIQINADIKDLIEKMLRDERFCLEGKFLSWVEKCKNLKKELKGINEEEGNKVISKISKLIDDRNYYCYRCWSKSSLVHAKF